MYIMLNHVLRTDRNVQTKRNSICLFHIKMANYMYKKLGLVCVCESVAVTIVVVVADDTCTHSTFV